MGHHYVPQEYLKGFEAQGTNGMLWTYDKSQATFALLPIKNVAQSPGYYDEETERLLNTEVEGPAKAALDRIRRREPLQQEDRYRLALYTATMMMRVPARRRKSLDLVPTVLADIVQQFRSRIDEWARLPGTDQELVARRRVELDEAAERMSDQPPAPVLEQVRSPWPRRQYVELLLAMTWRVVLADTRGRFVTSDNPAFFFEGYGLGSPEAEVTFPLASDVALLMSWQGPRGTTTVAQAKPALTKEVNRRVVSGAERFLFHHANADWIAAVAGKTAPFLSRIQWAD
jgi:hypothetical protein